MTAEVHPEDVNRNMKVELVDHITQDRIVIAKTMNHTPKTQKNIPSTTKGGKFTPKGSQI